jgi:hypothetical protein
LLLVQIALLLQLLIPLLLQELRFPLLQELSFLLLLLELILPLLMLLLSMVLLLLPALLLLLLPLLMACGTYTNLVLFVCLWLNKVGATTADKTPAFTAVVFSTECGERAFAYHTLAGICIRYP